MSVSFNLIDQDWILCITNDGELVELGLRDVLREAHRLRALHSENPVINAALMPVLLAILHRVFGPGDTRAWGKLWEKGQFSAEALEAYFAQWHERFDLFHPERPFYQVRDERVKPRSVIHLIQSIANTGTLFTHEDETVGMRLTPAAAARHLVAAQAFRTAGLSGLDEKFTDGTYTRGVLFWAQGKTLYETLMFNLFAYPQERVMPSKAEDAPAWEVDNPYQSRAVPNGYLDYLTWQSKRILLLPEGDGDVVRVHQMTVAPGMAIAPDVKSPQKRYAKKVKEGDESMSFLYFNSQKALWRDYYSLLPNGESKEVKPPYVVDWLSRISLYVDYPLRLLATGMLADQAKPIFYRQEEFPLPVVFLQGDGYRDALVAAMNSADATAEKLRNALNILAENVLMRGGSSKPDSGDRANLTRQWDAINLYWAALESHFWNFVREVADGHADAKQRWKSVLAKTAGQSLDRAAQMAGASPWALKGGVVSQRYLNGELKKLFPIEEQGA